MTLSSPSPKKALDLRKDFPIFSRTVNGKPLVFLDSAASAQKPACVIEKEADVYRHHYANVHRGIYTLSQEATELYENTRLKAAKLINASKPEECIFVRGATEAINLVANSWGRTNLKSADEILLTELEHHSNIVPWQLVAEATGAKIRVIPIEDDGSVDMDAYQKLLGDRTKMVAFLHVSNAIGAILPVKEMTTMAHAAGARVLIDGCQAVPHRPVDVQDIDADFYAFSAHKMYGPTGIGILYGKETLLETMPPWQGGGDMIDTVTFEKTTYNDLPHKFEAGTPNIAGGIAFGTAIDYLEGIGFDTIASLEHDLLQYARGQLKELNSICLYGPENRGEAILSFNINGIHPHDIGTILDQQGIAVRTGHHCCQPLMDRLGVNATVRASFGIYNTRDDVDKLVAGIHKALEIFT